MILSEQIKASRALLGWSAAELAKRSAVGATTLRRYEMIGGVPSANLSVLMKLKSTLEAAGIEFTGDPLVNPGVTLNLKRDT
jgi:transcriptional regulator with XRE-family HTH domain